MDLTTRYLGLDLAHPILPGASPLSDDPDTAKKLEDAGAPALVMSSLFEEELATMPLAKGNGQLGTPVVPADYRQGGLRVDPEDYFDRIYRLRHDLHIPVIASLNGTTDGGWLKYALAMEQAGADAVELNVYKVPTELGETSDEIEATTKAMVDSLRNRLAIPISVKLSPFATALPNFASHLSEAGAEGLVLFNRFYQPHIDWPSMQPTRTLKLSTGDEINLRLRWVAILAERTTCDLCLSGGVTCGEDVARAVACGANVAQVVTILYQKGPQHLAVLRDELIEAMNAADVHSVEGLRGRLAFQQTPHREALVRANYYRQLRQTKADLAKSPS
ncbi:MAG: dihydroorotate dehydrogenase-like protein [Planctomycetota bacterium]